MERAVSKRLPAGSSALSRRVRLISDFVVSTPSHGCATVPACVPEFCDGVVEFAEPFVLDMSNAPHLRLACDNDFRL